MSVVCFLSEPPGPLLRVEAPGRSAGAARSPRRLLSAAPHSAPPLPLLNASGQRDWQRPSAGTLRRYAVLRARESVCKGASPLLSPLLFVLLVIFLLVIFLLDPRVLFLIFLAEFQGHSTPVGANGETERPRIVFCSLFEILFAENWRHSTPRPELTAIP